LVTTFVPSFIEKEEKLSPSSTLSSSPSSSSAASAKNENKELISALFNVCTLKEARGGGVGKAMSAIAVASARASGCRWMVLDSSPSGFPVYQRLGFFRIPGSSVWLKLRYAFPSSLGLMGVVIDGVLTRNKFVFLMLFVFLALIGKFILSLFY